MLLNLVFCGIPFKSNNFLIDFTLFANKRSKIFLGVVLEGNSKPCSVLMIVDGGRVHSLCILLDGLMNMFDGVHIRRASRVIENSDPFRFEEVTNLVMRRSIVKFSSVREVARR